MRSRAPKEPRKRSGRGRDWRKGDGKIRRVGEPRCNYHRLLIEAAREFDLWDARDHSERQPRSRRAK